MLGRLIRDLPDFLHHPISPRQGAEIVARRLRARPDTFLALADRVIYRHRRSPYGRLLQVAGCELGDLRALVTAEGLEGALGVLANRGVYVDFDEFKGRRPIVRGSERLEPTPADFDNPRLPAHFEVRTGGTRGPGAAVRTSLRFLADQAPNLGLALGAHGLADANHVLWMGAPLRDMLRYARLGRPPIAWFHSLALPPWRVRAVGAGLWAYARLLGCPLPWPVRVDLAHPTYLARWLEARSTRGRSVCLTAFGGSAVRVAAAAGEAGYSLRDVAFIAIGEPFTTAKRAAIERAGARALARYGSQETGNIAYSCATPSFADDVHLFRDSFALVQRPRAVGGTGPEVDAFLLTTLLPSAPKIMLNVENGDHGRLERRDCDCALGALGLREHLSEIRSHEKLTGEGMTFVRTRLIPVIEELLPARFGGSSAEYQLLEEEGGDGILRLALLVSPRIGPLDEPELRRSFLAELGRDGRLESYMAGIWERAGTVQVRREEPRATSAGKILPFHVGRGAG